MDEHYCFFEEKGVDWDSVHAVYAKQVDKGMTDSQLLEVLGNMLATLRDGHVNLYASFDMARYWGFHETTPATSATRWSTSISAPITRLRRASAIASSTTTSATCGAPRFGCAGFGQSRRHLAVPGALPRPDHRPARQWRWTAHGGRKLAARFTNETRLVGYMQHKTGRGHRDFSSLQEQWLKPASGLRWQKPVAVLTNRQVFSAANEFVKYMKCCPNVVQVGDQTGGGAGLPFSSELPNGWSVRFSACPMYDHNRKAQRMALHPTSTWVSATTTSPLGATPSSRRHARL